MPSISVEVPDDLLTRLQGEKGGFGETLRRIAAFFLCSRGELSTSQAARLAWMAYGDFLDVAAHAKVELFPVDFDELTEAVNRGHALGRQSVARDPVSPGGPA
jgi:hypothetical protein